MGELLDTVHAASYLQVLTGALFTWLPCQRCSLRHTVQLRIAPLASTRCRSAAGL